MRKAELLSPRSAHGGRDLEHDDLVRIRDRVEHAVGVIALAKGADGTVSDALPAGGAIDLGDWLAATNVNRSVGGAVREVPNAKALDLLANLDAAKTANALLVVANERERAVPGVVLDVLLVRQAVNAKVVSYGLERAVSGAHAARAG